MFQQDRIFINLGIIDYWLVTFITWFKEVCVCVCVCVPVCVCVCDFYKALQCKKVPLFIDCTCETPDDCSAHNFFHLLSCFSDL